MIVVSVMAILASIGVPKYMLALETSKNTKVVQDLREISFQLDHWSLRTMNSRRPCPYDWTPGATRISTPTSSC